ncbi:ThiF family adenylyltransferase [Propioniciclava sp. MC1683]|uniref:ThiF family adenylyltransferase n=1 Tax=Propioniciclava sp. MC1683 TaxID=2760309 RepID=UPI0016011611|nr:ThiF family adenylyltransferase [Propioniciclava sp. MC1683]MBB1502705.1 ThiF family adenylyltransferase [Propioniciclava sp. MC1683]
MATLHATIGLQRAESGAVLFADDSGVITMAAFDAGSRRTGSTYTPDLAFVKAIDRWASRRQGLQFVGFAHSHPAGNTRPSGPDREYANRLMAFKKIDQLWLPILQTVPDTKSFSVHWWLARRVEGAEGTLADVVRTGGTVVTEDDTAWLDRVAGTLDVARLRDARVVAAGVGGARSALEDLARAGVGQFVLVDPDSYQATNLATQHVRRSELGLGKAIAAAEAIRDINPDALVVAIPGRIEDVLAEPVTRATLLGGELAGRRPARTLLGAWTDNHAANAFMGHVGLKTGLPAVFADLFHGAAAGAVAFVAPGITLACHRCWVGPRYAHYERGGANSVTSEGAEIWATSRINALKTRLSLLLLQAADDQLLALASTPTAVVKLRADVEETIGFGAFRRFEERIPEELRPSLALDTTLWLPVTPKADCPECGGTGDLLALKREKW